MSEEETHDLDSPPDSSKPAEGDGSGGSKPLSSKSAFTYSWDKYTNEKERKETAKRKLMDLMLEMEHVKLEAGYDSDESLSCYPGSSGKTKAVYQKSPIKPEKFPGKDFNRWELWVKHYKSVVKANGWNDRQAIAALPACLTSWAVEEFETVPRRFVEKLPGQTAPRLEWLLEELKPKMQQYRSKRATRSEFKAIRQLESENLKEYARRVRQLGELAFSEKTLAERDPDLRDQFLEGHFDSRIQQKLYEDETERNFCEILQRAQELELIQKNSENKRPLRADKIRYCQEDCDQLDVVRAGYPNSNNPVIEEKFAALQTSMTNVASRLDRLDSNICKQTDLFVKQIQDLPTSISTAIVGALGSAQSRGGVQSQQWQSQPLLSQLTPNSSASQVRTGSGHVTITNPPPSVAECFSCKEIGHFARDCPQRAKQDHLNWKRPGAQ